LIGGVAAVVFLPPRVAAYTPPNNVPRTPIASCNDRSVSRQSPMSLGPSSVEVVSEGRNREEQLRGLT
jgi:hypothetical protein